MKGMRLTVLAVCVGGMVFWQAGSLTAQSPGATGIPDPCRSSATGTGGHYLVCPSGDGDRLDGIGSVIYVELLDASDVPIPGWPAADIWLTGCGGELLLVGGASAINADADTDANGHTTISGAMTAGGCDNGLAVVVVGALLMSPPECTEALCLPYDVRSPDHSGEGGVVDGVVDVIDFADFASDYPCPPKPYNACIDFNWDGAVDIIDFSIFAQHYLH
jgi:hypothetical protein